MPSTFTFFLFTDPATSEIYTLSLHDALPILRRTPRARPHRNRHRRCKDRRRSPDPDRLSTDRCFQSRSEEHTSELQSRFDLVCRLLLEKKKTASPPPQRTASFFSSPVLSSIGVCAAPRCRASGEFLIRARSLRLISSSFISVSVCLYVS